MEQEKTELKKGKDERIRKEIIGFLQLPHPQFVGKREQEDWIAWLEKQGENNNTKFTFDDVLALQCCMEIVKKVQEDEALYKQLQSLHYRVHDVYHLKKQDEQKPIEWHREDEQNLNACLGYIPDEYLRRWLKDVIHARHDKVEPKFRVGDYIKHNKANFICKIISVNSGSYYVENIETNGGIELFDAEQNFHSWTIKDAKDGDVLIASDGSIFLFAGAYDSACKFYVALTACNNVITDKEVESGFWETSRAVHPATKEQRDFLFQKMKEAGYEWEAGKKELKNIEQESTWSGEVSLESDVERYIEQHKNELEGGYFNIRRIARHFFLLGLKIKGE